LDVSAPAEGRANPLVLGLDTPPPSEDTEEEQEVTAAAGAGVTSSRDDPANVDANHKRGTKRRRSPSPDPTPLRRVTRSLSARMPAQDEEQEEPPRASRSRSKGKQKEEMVVDRSLPSRLRREVQHLATPPLSEDTASLPDSASSASTRPARRGTSLHATNGSGLGRAKTVSRMPSVVNKQSQEDEPEARTLRTRLLTAAATQSDLTQRPAKPAIPRGLDGKPLPICSTCSNILPVISVDSKVIWGLDLTPTKARKRKEKRECPRCVFRCICEYQSQYPLRPSGVCAILRFMGCCGLSVCLAVDPRLSPPHGRAALWLMPRLVASTTKRSLH
jgi:[histone H4]-N-methyl-L-lysine20 N-methyltransferase